MTAAPLTLSDLLQALEYTPDEFIQICTQLPGQTFSTAVTPANAAGPLAQDRDTWFSINPTQGPERQNAGRGAASDVTRLAAIWVDLDVKKGGCPDIATAMQIITDLSAMLGQRPVAMTLSGHGVQPIWGVDGGHLPDGGAQGYARGLLRRWGRLVAVVAARHSSQVDSVFDLARILRCPATVNHKQPEQPRLVQCFADTGAALTLEQIGEVLDAQGIETQAGDTDDIGTVLSAPADWEYAAKTCKYARTLIAGWATDDARMGRHPWLVAQAVRLACLHRVGCITDADHTAAVATLVSRFRSLISGDGGRKENPGEVADTLGWGQNLASTFTEEHLQAELGSHAHLDQPMDAPPISNVPYQAPASPTVAISTTTAPESPQLSMVHSEDGHALALVATYADRIRFCPERNKWLYWDGRQWHWQPEGGGYVRELVKYVARAIPDGKADSWKRKALSAAGTSGVVRQAATDSRITVNLDAFDADPWVINTPDGLVNLLTGELRPATPQDLVTRMTNVAPVPPSTPMPAVWADFLSFTFGGDPDLAGYVQRLAGLALIGDVREQILPFWFGSGANGKSTLLDALMWVMRTGPDGYAIAAPAEMLMVRRHEGHPTELANLAGARLVVCSELEDGQRLAEARVKLVTGRDLISARFLYGQPFTFTPSHLIVLAGNHRPQATVGGPALWRRLRCVPFDHTVPVQQRDSDLPDKLRAVAPHILAWAIAGAVDYMKAGIRQPAVVTMATQEYERDQDTVGRFVSDRIEMAPNVGVITYKDMHAAYMSWCSETGDIPVTGRRLVKELVDGHGFVTGAANSVRYYSGGLLIGQGDNASKSRFN